MSNILHSESDDNEKKSAQPRCICGHAPFGLQENKPAIGYFAAFP